MKSIRVLIVDDHAIVRKGIRMLLESEAAIQVVGEAENGYEALLQVKNYYPDVVLMDLVMPQEDGIGATFSIKREYPEVKVIVLTTFNDSFKITAALKAGVDGYLLKDADGEALLQAIQAVKRGGMPLHPAIANYIREALEQADILNSCTLTEREKEVLQLVAKGLSNKEVAYTLSLTEGTVRVYVSHIFDKLNVSSRTEAAIQAARMGLVLLR
jgi:DNA-binding NarL/FixJ family response regulator